MQTNFERPRLCVRTCQSTSENQRRHVVSEVQVKTLRWFGVNGSTEKSYRRHLQAVPAGTTHWSLADTHASVRHVAYRRRYHHGKRLSYLPFFYNRSIAPF